MKLILLFLYSIILHRFFSIIGTLLPRLNSPSIISSIDRRLTFCSNIHVLREQGVSQHLALDCSLNMQDLLLINAMSISGIKPLSKMKIQVAKGSSHLLSKTGYYCAICFILCIYGELVFLLLKHRGSAWLAFILVLYKFFLVIKCYGCEINWVLPPQWSIQLTFDFWWWFSNF